MCYNPAAVSATDRFKNIYFCLLAIRSLVSSEIGDWRRLDVSLLTRTRAWKRGFLTSSYTAYGLGSRNAEDYMSDWVHRTRAHSVNGRMRLFLDDKLAFTWMMQRMGFSSHVPEVLAVLMSGKVYGIDAGSFAGAAADWLCHLNVGERLVVKPIAGSRGADVFVIMRTPEGFLVNRAERSHEEITRVLMRQKASLAIRYVGQHEYAHQIFAHTTNTIRLLTIRDSIGPFAVAAFHRFGTERSVPVDTFGRGGLFCSVDLCSGRIGPAVRLTKSGVPEFLTCHPDSRAAVEGIFIPRWREALKGVLHIAEAVPFLRYVGWDIAITPQGWVVLEGNANTDIGFQIVTPLLSNPRARRFLESEGLARKKQET